MKVKVSFYERGKVVETAVAEVIEKTKKAMVLEFRHEPGVQYTFKAIAPKIVTGMQRWKEIGSVGTTATGPTNGRGIPYHYGMALEPALITVQEVG